MDELPSPPPINRQRIIREVKIAGIALAVFGVLFLLSVLFLDIGKPDPADQAALCRDLRAKAEAAIADNDPALALEYTDQWKAEGCG
jgi:hypothetical protein